MTIKRTTLSSESWVDHAVTSTGPLHRVSESSTLLYYSLFSWGRGKGTPADTFLGQMIFDKRGNNGLNLAALHLAHHMEQQEDIYTAMIEGDKDSIVGVDSSAYDPPWAIFGEMSLPAHEHHPMIVVVRAVWLITRDSDSTLLVYLINKRQKSLLLPALRSLTPLQVISSNRHFVGNTVSSPLPSPTFTLTLALC